jgi:hypothetical protein
VLSTFKGRKRFKGNTTSEKSLRPCRGVTGDGAVRGLSPPANIGLALRANFTGDSVDYST